MAFLNTQPLRAAAPPRRTRRQRHPFAVAALAPQPALPATPPLSAVRGRGLVQSVTAQPGPPTPALAPALLTLGLTFGLGVLLGQALGRNSARRRAVRAANRASSGRDALSRARSVLGVVSGGPEAQLADAALQARAAAAESGLQEMRAELERLRTQDAEFGGGAFSGGQAQALRELSLALSAAGREFEDALAEKEEALEEATLLHAILAEKDVQIAALERMLDGNRAS